MINQEALKSDLVGLINKHITEYLDNKYPRSEKLVDNILNYSSSYGKIEIIDKNDRKNEVSCECKECDFNENGKCVQPFPHIDEDGCNIFLDKWDEIESRDR